MAIDTRDYLRASAIAAVWLAAAISAASAGTLGGPLELQDAGSFFVGGQMARSTHPSNAAGAAPGQIMINQMYVQYRIPKQVSGPPIILVHGAGHTGVTYETTPDGREGWATYFTRKGFPVYVVDHSGRGRSGFDPSVINRAKAEGNAALLPDIPLTTRERSWIFFRLGPAYPTAHPGSQFPLDALDQYYSQLVPNTETTLSGGGANTVKALAALLDRIGPAIVLVHSQSGAYGLELIRARADKVRAFVDVEGNCTPVSDGDIAKSFAKVPMLAVFGDNSVGAAGPNGDVRRNGCIATTDALRQAGGTARFLLLPEQGIKGNSHMMMMDKNNLQIADLIIAWLGEVTGKK
jgi:pimeloyl-ACP methyl ester carboxylesterase